MNGEPFVKTLQRDPSRWPALRRELEQQVADATAELAQRVTERDAIELALKKLEDRADAAATLQELQERTGIKVDFNQLTAGDRRYLEFLRVLEVGASRMANSCNGTLVRCRVHLDLLAQFERGTHHSQHPASRFGHWLLG
jgi:hypothetical protein